MEQRLTKYLQTLKKHRLVPLPLLRCIRQNSKTGETVVVKVQRQGIYETMSRDIAFLHRAVKLMPPINMAGLVDMNQVLDEMWVVAQEEMNFLGRSGKYGRICTFE